jgi:hypothetical protein
VLGLDHPLGDVLAAFGRPLERRQFLEAHGRDLHVQVDAVEQGAGDAFFFGVVVEAAGVVRTNSPEHRRCLPLPKSGMSVNRKALSLLYQLSGSDYFLVSGMGIELQCTWNGL